MKNLWRCEIIAFVAALHVLSTTPSIACLSNRPLQRSGFATAVKGFDSHNDYREQVNARFETIDTALKNFVTEMKAQGIWDDVVMVTMSDFGRKLTPNGRGTDHAWGGIHACIDMQVRLYVGFNPTLTVLMLARRVSCAYVLRLLLNATPV